MRGSIKLHLTNIISIVLYLSKSKTEMIKIDASTSNQPCTSFGVNKHLGQGFADLYNEGELIFVASECTES